MPSRNERRLKLRRFFAALARIFRGVLGAPDYERYLEHCRRAGHPVQLSEREFVAAALEARGRMPRCC